MDNLAYPLSDLYCELRVQVCRIIADNCDYPVLLNVVHSGTD